MLSIHGSCLWLVVACRYWKAESCVGSLGNAHVFHAKGCGSSYISLQWWWSRRSGTVLPIGCGLASGTTPFSCLCGHLHVYMSNWSFFSVLNGLDLGLRSIKQYKVAMWFVAWEVSVTGMIFLWPAEISKRCGCGSCMLSAAWAQWTSMSSHPGSRVGFRPGPNRLFPFRLAPEHGKSPSFLAFRLLYCIFHSPSLVTLSFVWSI